MDEIINQFLSVSLLIVAIGSYLATAAVRAVVEYLWPLASTSRTWREFILPALPIVLGAAIAFFVPDLHAAIVARLILGAFAGIHGSFVYGRIKAILK